MMKNILYIFACFSMFIFMVCEQEPLVFEKIKHETIYRTIPTTRHPEISSKYLSESWIVHNFKDTPENEAHIDEFVCAYVDTIIRPYGSLTMTFYKYSRRHTNMETLTRRYDNISESLSHDYLWHYEFSKKGFFRKVKLKNVKNREFFFKRPACLGKKKAIGIYQ